MEKAPVKHNRLRRMENHDYTPYADYSSETAAARITRAQCLDMNAYAADLATITLSIA